MWRAPREKFFFIQVLGGARHCRQPFWHARRALASSGWSGRKGVLSAHFGVRPVPGDAVLFYMKVPGERKADRHAFHAGCPLVRGSKDAIQKFLQHGGTNDVSDLRNHGRGRAGAYGRCEK